MRDFLYDNLINSPNTMRLQILDVKLTVMQIIRDMDTDQDGRPVPMLSPERKPIYEIRGISQDGGTNVYIATVTDLPPGMAVGTSVHYDARLVGYFFKVQGYYSEQQQREIDQSKRVKPSNAPLIIGRLIWAPQPVAVAEETPVWVFAVIGAVGMIVLLGAVYWSSRRTRRLPIPRSMMTAPADPDAPDVDAWLDHAQRGQGKSEESRFSHEIFQQRAYSEGAARDTHLGVRVSGNILAGNGESKDGGQSNGHAAAEGNRFNNESTGNEPEAHGNDNPA